MAASVAPKVLSLSKVIEHLTARLPEKGHESSRAIVAQVSKLAEATSRLHAMAGTRNPTETEGAHSKKVILGSQQLGRETTATLNRVADFLRSGRAALEARIVERTKFAPDPYSAEIRAVYRNASQTERTRMLSEFVEQGRGPEMAAILKAHRSLTGISEEHIAQYTAAFIAKNAPEELAEIEALDETFEGAGAVLRVAGEVARDYSDPAKLAEITRAEAAAEAAAKAFTGMVGA